MNLYHSRLRQLAATCEFTDIGKEIKSQINQFCIQGDSTMILEALLAEARALEVLEQQKAASIESPRSANVVLCRKSETLDKKACCFNCGESWPHDAKAGYKTTTELGIMRLWKGMCSKSLFSGLGRMKNVEVKLHIDENLRPTHQSHRCIPFRQ